MTKQLSLGKLINELGKYSETAHVAFDFANTYPSGLGSSRGYYEHLAIDYADARYGDKREMMTVGELLSVLRSAVGKSFTGWKGGEYFMYLDTPLWVDHQGIWSSTAIVGVREETKDYLVLLQTRRMEQ